MVRFCQIKGKGYRLLVVYIPFHISLKTKNKEKNNKFVRRFFVLLLGLTLLGSAYCLLAYNAYKSSLKSVREVVYQRAGRRNRLRVHDYIFQIEDIIKFKVRREMLNSGKVTPEVLNGIVDNAIQLSAKVDSDKVYACTEEVASRVISDVMEDYKKEISDEG